MCFQKSIWLKNFVDFKRFREIKEVGQVENHFESQPHDVRTQVEHLIASTKKKNTVGELDQTPRQNKFRFDQIQYFLNIGLGVIHPTFQTN
jgi:hypothetical protein